MPQVAQEVYNMAMRKKLVRIIVVGGVLTLLIGTIFAVIQLIPVNEIALWTEIEEWRQKEGLSLLKDDAKLCQLADKRVNDIQASYNHDPRSIRAFQINDGYPYGISENLAGGPYHIGEEEEILTAWLNSPSHRAALEGDWKYSCIRCKNGMCVQLFTNKETNR